MLEHPGFSSVMAVKFVLMIFGVIAIVKMTKSNKKLEEKKPGQQSPARAIGSTGLIRETKKPTAGSLVEGFFIGESH